MYYHCSQVCVHGILQIPTTERIMPSVTLRVEIKTLGCINTFIATCQVLSSLTVGILY